MKRSTDRILTTHAGSLPRPDDLREMVAAKAAGNPYDHARLANRTREAVGDVVRRQLACRIDCVNDGEFGKSNFSNYARERLTGFEEREIPGDSVPVVGIQGRDIKEFPGYFLEHGGFAMATVTGGQINRRQIGLRADRRQLFCVGPLSYVGTAELQLDLENFRAALQGVNPADAFLPAVAPGTIEHWLHNAYYPSDEQYLEAIADAMHVEYKAITDAGFILQIDDPDLPDAWQMHPDMSVADYRRYAALRLEALNHALRDVPVEQTRLHVCWGSYHGPHKHDIPLKEIVDLVLSVKAQAYSVEAANPRHEHEWKVWKDVRLPEGKILIPGIVGHSSDFIEHPELVAERIVRFADIVGKENVIAGTDCGLGGRVGHPDIVWAKLEALAEGADLASEELWG
ncbi:MAG TPA: cobalamin-independent methionine synthase II family protein [Chloroflexota bacterium]|nr:cobalamin-independent methionine synthase II family protein [Chloroflexota bacterium]